MKHLKTIFAGVALTVAATQASAALETISYSGTCSPESVTSSAAFVLGCFPTGVPDTFQLEIVVDVAAGATSASLADYVSLEIITNGTTFTFVTATDPAHNVDRFNLVWGAAGIVDFEWRNTAGVGALMQIQNATDVSFAHTSNTGSLCDSAITQLAEDGTACGPLSANPIAILGTWDTPAAVPVPAAAWLFGSALLGLVGIGRKRA